MAGSPGSVAGFQGGGISGTDPNSPEATPERPGGMPVREIRGHLLPRQFTTLASEVAAKVEQITVREGERFKAGQPLIVFDCTQQKTQLNRATAVAASAERVLAANRRLVVLKAAGELETEMSALEAAKARGDMQVIKATLEKCQIVAPFAGRVAEQKIREQQFAQPGQPLLEILDDSKLELEFIAPSHWLTWLKVEQTFQMHCDETGKSYPAQVSRLGARVDPVSQSMKIMARINGSFPELVSGMSGRILLRPPP
ncbi:MAG: efflux RND transporter periplasmic adaptor subunit [Magnetococcales bacterium]|nr:efflux RND transporter periplasmic adaptor subunit [Magnetococcales bacterium]